MMRDRLFLPVLCAVLSATVSTGGEVRFGDKSLRGKASDHIAVIGPSNRVASYLQERTAAFEQVDPAVVERMKGEVLIDLPWRLIGGEPRVSKPTKLVFTKPGTREVVQEFPVVAEEVPLSNAFGKESVGYHGIVLLSLVEFGTLNAEMDIHVVHDGYTFTDKWKKAYYEKVLKPK